MRRWVETVEIRNFRNFHREITIDFSLPSIACEGTRWMMPTAFLSKKPVAPDLEVRDFSGGAISVPTKPENMAMTFAALEHLGKTGAINLHAIPELEGLVHQVIFGDLFEARVARLLAVKAMDPEDVLLGRLLHGLEDQFLLWIPVSGDPGCDQQVQISRRGRVNRNQLIPRRRVWERRQVQTALGLINVEWFPPSGRRQFQPRVALQRFQRILGLAPMEFQHEITEAHRFFSFHLRVLAPDGLLIRDVGMDVPKPGEEEDPDSAMEELNDGPGVLCQGLDTEMAHLHFSKSDNPTYVLGLIEFGIRTSVTSLWATAVVFTSCVLWAMHRLAPPEFILNGHLEATVAILLVGPSLAAAWAIREDTEVVDAQIWGARSLLFVSAGLAVATALSFDGFSPFHLETDQAVEIYASLSYGVSALIVAGWVLTRETSWFVYRKVLTTGRRNLTTTAAAVVVGLVVVAHEGLHNRLVGAALLAAGMALGSVAAHPGGASTTYQRGRAPFLAALGAIGMLFGAGYFLGFYESLLRPSVFRDAFLSYEGLILLATLVQYVRSD